MTENKTIVNKPFEIDKERFGTFVAQLRKGQGLTQKELAAQLYVSDKAVSKWERNLSLPDVVLLQPLADALGVTVEELLMGERIETKNTTKIRTEQLEKKQAEVGVPIYVSDEELEKRKLRSAKWHITFPVVTVITVVELVMLLLNGHSIQQLLEECLLVFEGLFLFFGIYFCFFIKEVLPEYYDKYHITNYADGAFRINIPVRISNRNWGMIIQATRLGIAFAMLLLPLGYFVAYRIDYIIWNTYLPAIAVIICLLAFGPMIAMAKKYE